MGHLSIRKKKTGRARHSGDGPTFSHETILSDNSRTPEKKTKKNTTHTHLATSPKRARELRKKMVLKIKTTQKNSLPHEKINLQRIKE